MKTATRASIERDDTRGEDPQVRQAILSALNGHAGTVVGMDPRTGRVYSMVNQQLGVHAAFKPCSTIKLVVGLAGLHENEIGSSGILELTGGDYRMGLTDALAHSDNGYFQEVGEKLGYERVLEYARDFGLGEPTGLNTTGETGGLIPLRIPPRGITFMSSHGDGFAVTTLQLASLTSAIVNGGYLYKPQILRTDKEISGFKPSLRRKIEVSDADRARVLEGMMGSAAFGTGKSSATQGALVAGKTGTCSDEVSKIGLYTSVNNVDNPTLALAVIVRGSSERGASAATIAGEVYRQLAPRFNIALTRPRRVTEGTRASSGSDK
jgi:cell division protein FtsI/penicillin-binding protein 2